MFVSSAISVLQSQEQIWSGASSFGARVARFLEETGGGDPVTALHRGNRVGIFDSDLFYKSADLDFRPGYESRRINVAMLFGYGATD